MARQSRSKSGSAPRADPHLAIPTRTRSRSLVPTLEDPVTDYPYPEKRSAKLKDATFANGEVFKYREEMMAMFYKFVCERHAIQQRRLAGLPQPWTRDKWLHEYPFTNVFRVLDRNTQYILHRVIGESPKNVTDAVFRVLLFRTFNRIETWELLETHLGTLKWKTFEVDKFVEILSGADTAIYNPAYIIPAPKLGHKGNLRNHVNLINVMMTDELFTKDLRDCKHIRDAHARLLSWPSIGGFIAMQVLLDLNMLPYFNWSEDEWVEIGPGSKSCLEKMFPNSSIAGSAQLAIRYLRDNQWAWFSQIGVDASQIPRVSPAKPRGLTMVDIEHSLCECDKYSRGKLAHIAGKRTTVGKRQFRPRAGAGVPTADIPEHWLAERVLEEPPCPPPVEGEDVYEVECIVDEDKAKARYLVRWLGWGPEDDTWEPKEVLTDGSPNVVKEWEERKERVVSSIAAHKKNSKNLESQEPKMSARGTRQANKRTRQSSCDTEPDSPPPRKRRRARR